MAPTTSLRHSTRAWRRWQNAEAGPTTDQKRRRIRTHTAVLATTADDNST